MRLFEVNLTRTVDLLIAGESEEEVLQVVQAADKEEWDLPEWEIYTTDLIDDAKTEQACDKLLACPPPDVVIWDGVARAFEDVPEVMAMIEQAIRDRKSKIYMDEHQMKLPGFE